MARGSFLPERLSYGSGWRSTGSLKKNSGSGSEFPENRIWIRVSRKPDLDPNFKKKRIWIQPDKTQKMLMLSVNKSKLTDKELRHLIQINHRY